MIGMATPAWAVAWTGIVLPGRREDPAEPQGWGAAGASLEEGTGWGLELPQVCLLEQFRHDPCKIHPRLRRAAGEEEGAVREAGGCIWQQDVGGRE